MERVLTTVFADALYISASLDADCKMCALNSERWWYHVSTPRLPDLLAAFSLILSSHLGSRRGLDLAHLVLPQESDHELPPGPNLCNVGT